MSEPSSVDPWDRFGWVMGVIWLVFLGFPLGTVLTADRHWVWRVTAVALIAAFATVYVHGLVRIGRTASWREVVRWGGWYVAALVALVAAVAAFIGADALGMATFVVAMAMFVLPLAWALMVFAITVVVTSVVASTVAAPWSGRDEAAVWFLVGIVILVGLATLAVRVLDQMGSRHRRLEADLALAADRDRVARDVHDVLGHSLTVVTVKAELAERLVDGDPAHAKAELAEIQSLARQSLAEIRATVGGLRSAGVADQLGAARTALDGAGITADLTDDPAVVDPRHRAVLGWALREAVTNVVRHSGATSCRVQLGPDWLCVADDGRGLSGSAEGNGLRGLRERVGSAGGTVELATGEGGAGTTVRVRL